MYLKFYTHLILQLFDVDSNVTMLDQCDYSSLLEILKLQGLMLRLVSRPYATSWF